MSFVVIIPARYASTRLPGKPLVDINGLPMIVRVLEQARASGADRVIVATDHPDVARAVEAAGGEVCMTRADHHSGTERLAEVIEKYAFPDDTIIVNVQGDEPLILGEIDPPSSVLRRAYVLGANAIRFGSDFFAEVIDVERWRWRDVSFRVELPQPALWAPIQRNNAATAIAALRALDRPVPRAAWAPR